MGYRCLNCLRKWYNKENALKCCNNKKGIKKVLR